VEAGQVEAIINAPYEARWNPHDQRLTTSEYLGALVIKKAGTRRQGRNAEQVKAGFVALAAERYARTVVKTVAL
jgi:hypothetical protein